MRRRHKSYTPLKSPQWTRSDHSGRFKRQTGSAPKDYYIDIIAATDFAFYQFWLQQAGQNKDLAIESMKKYISYMFNGINARYNSITTLPFLIHIHLSGFFVATTAAGSTWTETVKEPGTSGTPQVNANTVLEKMEAWFNDSRGSLPVPNVDHVMLFTGYDLYGEDNGFRFNNTAGFAIIGSMCYTDGRSVSVVEDHGGFQSETTATHELGHSLGAKHDGTENPCNSADRYVMSGGVHPETEANRRNPWQFSDCSLNYFKAHLETLTNQRFEESCLLKKSSAASDVPIVEGLPGQDAGPDEQCRQIYGTRSYLCRGERFGTAEDVCVSMFCRNPDTTNVCTLNTAARGTCCGNGKWCIDGRCIETPAAVDCYMSATCPFGQRQGVVYKNLTCDQMPSGNCYDNNFRQICCEMCDKNRTDVAGCEYGDKVLNCESKYCGRRYENGELYDLQCCGTCQYSPPVTNTSTTTPTPDNTTTTSTTTTEPDELIVCRDVALINNSICPAFLDTNGLLYCCRADVRDNHCCNTCRQRKSADLTCPYGDCDPGCSVLRNLMINCNADQRSKCCKTCQEVADRLGPDTATSTTTTTTTNNNNNNNNVETIDCVPIEGVKTCGAGKAMLNLMAIFLSHLFVKIVQ